MGAELGKQEEDLSFGGKSCPSSARLYEGNGRGDHAHTGVRDILVSVEAVTHITDEYQIVPQSFPGGAIHIVSIICTSFAPERCIGN